MLIPTFAGSEITDSARGGGLYFRDILLNISFLGGQMDIRMFYVITFCSTHKYKITCGESRQIDGLPLKITT